MEKKVVYIFVGIGGTVGGYLPVIFGASAFSGWSIVGSTIGGIIGIVLAVKIS